MLMLNFLNYRERKNHKWSWNEKRWHLRNFFFSMRKFYFSCSCFGYRDKVSIRKSNEILSFLFLNHQHKYRNDDLVIDSEYRIAELLAAIHFVKASSHLPSPGASPADRKGQVENQVRNVHGNEEAQREASHAQVLELRCELFWRLEEFLAEQTSEHAWYAKSWNIILFAWWNLCNETWVYLNIR